MRRILVLVGAVVLVAVVAIGLGQAGGAREEQPDTFDLERARQQLQGAPPPLAGCPALRARGAAGPPHPHDREQDRLVADVARLAFPGGAPA